MADQPTTTDELLLQMAGYPQYVALLDTPGLAKLFNDLCLRAKAADAERQRADDLLRVLGDVLAMPHSDSVLAAARRFHAAGGRRYQPGDPE